MSDSDSPKISIVIPVYNGEKYLAQTLESILKQTFAYYEVICVNDSSTDDSLLILKEYEFKDPRIRIFSTESNLGIVPKVINYSIPHIRGDYYVYSSQDDLFSEDWLENMYREAVNTGSDAVIPDLVLFYETEIAKNRSLIGVNGNRDIVLTNREAVLLSLDWTIPGNALWKTALIRKIGYYDFGMYADEYSARIFFFNCNKIVFSTGTFYYRQDNPNAITKKLSVKSFDLPYTDFMIWQFLKNNNFENEIQEQILLRAITNLVDMKITLIKQNFKLPFSKYKLIGAEERIKKCFLCFKGNAIHNVFLKQKGFKKFIMAFAFIGNYSLFTLVCFGYALLKAISYKLKFWQSIKQ